MNFKDQKEVECREQGGYVTLHDIVPFLRDEPGRVLVVIQMNHALLFELYRVVTGALEEAGIDFARSGGSCLMASRLKLPNGSCVVFLDSDRDMDKLMCMEISGWTGRSGALKDWLPMRLRYPEKRIREEAVRQKLQEEPGKVGVLTPPATAEPTINMALYNALESFHAFVHRYMMISPEATKGERAEDMMERWYAHRDIVRAALEDAMPAAILARGGHITPDQTQIVRERAGSEKATGGYIGLPDDLVDVIESTASQLRELAAQGKSLKNRHQQIRGTSAFAEAKRRFDKFDAEVDRFINEGGKP